MVCDLVYAELCTYFSSQRECEAFLAENEIRVESLSREALFLASRTWRAYRKQGGPRTRILADFPIGAHAQTQAQRLLSQDRGFYTKLFPSLDLRDPSARKRAEAWALDLPGRDEREHHRLALAKFGGRVPDAFSVRKLER